MSGDKRMSNKQKSNAEVNFQFKLLSAVGIFIIVAGHCYKGGFSLLSNWFPNYSYNIALFVFISGYFYNEKHDDKPFTYIFKRTKRLLFPAYIWNLVYGALAWILQQNGFEYWNKIDAYSLFIMPFVDGEELHFNLGSWFVYPLFLVCVINVVLRRLLKIRNWNNDYFLLAVYLCGGMAAIYCVIYYQPINHGVMKLLFRTLFMLPMYQLGRLYRTKLEQYDTLKNPIYFGILFVVQLILVTFFHNLEYFPSSMTSFYNGLILPYVTAVTGIAFWLRVSRILAPAVSDRRFVCLIADNTYHIMIHHMFGFWCVKMIFYVLYEVFGWFDEAVWTQMFQNFWWYYLPKGITEYAIAYVAGGFVVSILIGKLSSSTKIFFYNRIIKRKV